MNYAKSAYVILSNDVKGNTTLSDVNSVFNVKVSHPARQTNPFKRNTMPVVAQLGQLGVTAQAATQSSQTTNSASSTANATNNQSNSNQNNSNQNSNAQGANNNSNNSNQASQNQTDAKQQIAQNKVSTAATSKDTEQETVKFTVIPLQTMANRLDTFLHYNGIGGGHAVFLWPYFISLSGKVNLARN